MLDEKCAGVRGQIEELFRSCEESEGTVKGYVSEVMHILAKVTQPACKSLWPSRRCTRQI